MIQEGFVKQKIWADENFGRYDKVIMSIFTTEYSKIHLISFYD